MRNAEILRRNLSFPHDCIRDVYTIMNLKEEEMYHGQINEDRIMFLYACNAVWMWF